MKPKKRPSYRDLETINADCVIYRRGDASSENWYARINLRNGKYKVISLRTKSERDATSLAYEKVIEMKTLLRQKVPIFRRKFENVSKEFLLKQEKRKVTKGSGEISDHRYRVIKNIVEVNLNKFLGDKSISSISDEHWNSYVQWRRENSVGRSNKPISDATIRSEMALLKQIMGFAVEKNYISANDFFKNFKARQRPASVSRDTFSKEQYRQLYLFMRNWERQRGQGISEANIWTRKMVRSLILLLANTGLRIGEAKNLKWGDVSIDNNKNQVALNIYGKNKRRQVIIPASRIGIYIERVRKIAKSTSNDAYVFTTFDGEKSKHLYERTISDLFESAGVSQSSAGNRLSTYSLRHYFATQRLSRNADVYSLAKIMGTSHSMIQQHYGHISSEAVTANVFADVYAGQRRRESTPAQKR